MIPNGSKIYAFLTDLDGCLTDGCYYRSTLSHWDYEEDGNTQLREKGVILGKKFNTRDWHGMMLLGNAGVTIGVITGSKMNVIDEQAKAVGFEVIVKKGVVDKLKEVEDTFVKGMGFKWENISYIGDDEPDIPLLMKVGIAACPHDAEHDVIEAIRSRDDALVLNRVGGNGCVREFANYIRKVNRR